MAYYKVTWMATVRESIVKAESEEECHKKIHSRKERVGQGT